VDADRDLAMRDPDAIQRARNQLHDEMECQFIQFEF
jgi:hypothetical protein